MLSTLELVALCCTYNDPPKPRVSAYLPISEMIQPWLREFAEAVLLVDNIYEYCMIL